MTVPKAVLNPDGAATMVYEFAENGVFYYECGQDSYEQTGGNMQDGLIVAGASSYDDIYANIYLIDSESGEEIHVFDFSEWFVSPEQEGQKCGGPGKLRFNPNKPFMVWNVTHASCTRLCFNPWEETDNIWWANMNGDYYCDKNYSGYEGFDEAREWICNDYNVPAYNYCVDNDDYDFVHYINNLSGTGKWQILGPDGSGIATAMSLGQVEGNNRHWLTMVYGDTAYDGLYSQTTTADGSYAGWQGYDFSRAIFSTGIYSMMALERKHQSNTQFQMHLILLILQQPSPTQ